MSENIQSISLGTYTLGETNKLTFSAGPGIKIDEPNAGTVRIGNDETVLYEILPTQSNTGSFVVSEPFSGFERIKVLFGRGYDNAIYNEFAGDGSQWRCHCTIQASDVILNYSNYTISGGVSAIKNSDLRWTIKTNSTVKYEGTNFPNNVYKIIGINRISGGNE